MGLTYWSSSKKRHVALADMAAPHLLNAMNKLHEDVENGRHIPKEMGDPVALLLAMKEEVRRRGLDMEGNAVSRSAAGPPAGPSDFDDNFNPDAELA